MSAFVSSAVPADVAELQRERGTVDPSRHMAEALDEILTAVIDGQQVRCRGEFLDFQSALSLIYDTDDAYDLLAVLLRPTAEQVVLDVQATKRDAFEKLLRSKLESSTLVQTRAAELAFEERDHG